MHNPMKIFLRALAYTLPTEANVATVDNWTIDGPTVSVAPITSWRASQQGYDVMYTLVDLSFWGDDSFDVFDSLVGVIADLRTLDRPWSTTDGKLIRVAIAEDIVVSADPEDAYEGAPAIRARAELQIITEEA